MREEKQTEVHTSISLSSHWNNRGRFGSVGLSWSFWSVLGSCRRFAIQTLLSHLVLRQLSFSIKFILFLCYKTNKLKLPQPMTRNGDWRRLKRFQRIGYTYIEHSFKCFKVLRPQRHHSGTFQFYNIIFQFIFTSNQLLNLL